VSIPFAHAGHWLASAAYAAPVIVLVGWIGVSKVKDAMRRRGEDATSADNPLGAAPD